MSRELNVEGICLTVRPLKRGEIKSLKKEGFNLSNIDPETADALLDRVFDMIFTEEEIGWIDELPYHYSIKTIWPEILKETFGSREEEKNLGESGAE